MIQQISVFLENRTGRLADVLFSLKKAGINIYALHVADTTDYGILRIIADNPPKAQAALINDGFTVALTDVLAVAMEDKTGALFEIVQSLVESSVAVEYIYAFAGRSGINPAIVIIKPQHLKEAENMIKSKQFKLVGLEDI